LKEKKFAEGFKKFYLHEKRMNWRHTSTKRPGVPSDSNTLESHNNTGKAENNAHCNSLINLIFIPQGLRLCSLKVNLISLQKCF